MKKFILPIVLIAFAACNNCEPKEEFKSDLEEKSVYSSVLLNDENDPFTDGEADPAFLDWIFDEVIKNESAEIYSTDDKKLSSEEVNAILNQTRTAMLEDPDHPGTFFEVKDTLSFTKNDVVELIMKESWAIDKSSMKMKKQVEKIAPIVNIYDDEGALKGKIMLFWVKMK